MHVAQHVVEALMRSFTPPTVTYNRVFRKTPKFYRVYWRKREYVAEFRVHGDWNGRRFRHVIIYGLRNGLITKLDDRKPEIIG